MAAVHAGVDPNRLDSVRGMGFATSREPPTFENAAEVVGDAVGKLPEPPDCPVVAECGEFDRRSRPTASWVDPEAVDEEPAIRVEQFPGPTFKYVESIAERETVQAPHHAAYAARQLFV